MPNSWCKGERDWSIGGGNGKVIFIEIMEFALGLKGWLTCRWRKGSGGGHSSISLFSTFICSLCYVLDIVLGIGHTVEDKKSFSPYGPCILVGEDGGTVNKETLRGKSDDKLWGLMKIIMGRVKGIIEGWLQSHLFCE